MMGCGEMLTESESSSGFCAGESIEKVRENTEIKENVVSQNMREKAQQKGGVSGVGEWTWI